MPPSFDWVTSGGASGVSTGASEILYWARPICIYELTQLTDHFAPISGMSKEFSNTLSAGQTWVGTSSYMSPGGGGGGGGLGWKDAEGLASYLNGPPRDKRYTTLTRKDTHHQECRNSSRTRSRRGRRGSAPPLTCLMCTSLTRKRTLLGP